MNTRNQTRKILSVLLLGQNDKKRTVTGSTM